MSNLSLVFINTFNRCFTSRVTNKRALVAAANFKNAANTPIQFGRFEIEKSVSQIQTPLKRDATSITSSSMMLILVASCFMHRFGV